MSGKDRRLALLELAKRRGAKGTGSSSSTTEPIAAPPLSVAPAEGPEQGKKRKRLVKASTSTAAAAAASTEEESSGSPLVHRQRKRSAVEGASSLQPGEIEVVEVEEGSSPPPCAQTATEPINPPSPGQQLPPATKLPSSPQQANHLVHPLILLGVLLPKLGVHHHHRCQSLPPLLNVVGLARAQALLGPPTRIQQGHHPSSTAHK